MDALISPFRDIRIKPIFRWYDAYAGIYWDDRRGIAYVFPVPFFGFKIWVQHPREYYVKFTAHAESEAISTLRDALERELRKIGGRK